MIIIWDEGSAENKSNPDPAPTLIRNDKKIIYILGR